MLSNNLFALLLTFLISLAWLRINDFAAHRGWISSRLSRKIIHIGTGPIFVLFWLLFNESTNARFLAALVPLTFTIQFFLIGTGKIQDDAAVQAMSRSGDRREILRGPLFYGIIFVILTIVYWLYTPIGIVALMILCGGDGLAEILGRRFGKVRLPWNRNKSWMGSFGMFTGGWLTAVGIITAYTLAGVFPGSLSIYIIPISICAFGAAIVESFPLEDVDNITITATALLLGHLVF